MIRLVNNIDIGTLTGMADNELIVATESCEPSVYFLDDGDTPNPISIDDDPESTEIDPFDLG